MFIQKIILFIALTIIIIPSISCSGKETPDDQAQGNSIKLGISLTEFSELDCKGLIPLQSSDVKNQKNNNHVRKFFKFEPSLSVAMTESDLHSYFEFIFENGELIKINKYDKNGNLIESYKEFYCEIGDAPQNIN